MRRPVESPATVVESPSTVVESGIEGLVKARQARRKAVEGGSKPAEGGLKGRACPAKCPKGRGKGTEGFRSLPFCHFETGEGFVKGAHRLREPAEACASAAKVDPGAGQALWTGRTFLDLSQALLRTQPSRVVSLRNTRLQPQRKDRNAERGRK